MCQKKVQIKWQNDSLPPWRLTLTFIQKQAWGAEHDTVVMSSYDNNLNFSQCYCTSSKSCKLPNDTDTIDIGKFVDFRTTISLPYIILALLLPIITYVVVESFVGKQISMHRFIVGPEIERNDPTIDNESQCDLIFKTCNQLT